MTVKLSSLAALAIFAMTGCSTRTIPQPGSAPVTLSGSVHGGQQPVSAANMQLFDVSDGGSPLISSPPATDSQGTFSITGLYSCPSSSDQVVLVAIGGDPGSGTNNSSILMSALGPCGNLTSSTSVVVNEITTVATIFAYSSFFNVTAVTAGDYITGSTAGAYLNFLDVVDPATGTALSTNGPDVPLQLNSLGNTLATCINSSTMQSGYTQTCSDLVNLATPYVPQNSDIDSATAVYFIAMNTSFNVAAVVNDASGNPPFQPSLSAAPAYWDLHFTH